MIIAHYDADGTQTRIVQFGTPQKELAKDLAADGEGGVFTSGYTKGSFGAKNQGEGDAFVARFDSSLKEVWTHQIGTSGWDEFQGLLPDGSGGVFAVADTSGDLGGKGNAGDFDAVIARFDEQGLVWIKQFGTPGEDAAMGLATDGLGGAFVGGFTTGDLFGENQGSYDAFIFHFADGCDPCDANCDGSVDLTDVEAFIKLLLGGDPCDFCTGDANDDGSIDLTDVEPFIACLLG